MDLLQWVAQRIDQDATLTEEAGLLVLASLQGDQDLEALLTGSHIAPTPVAEPHDAAAVAPEPAGAFLKSLAVQGFRGIGQQVTVELTPQPGLTIIAGRNGSGKSSLAEALEVALTGTTYRWKNKAAQWKEHWRNLHHEGAANIVVQVAEEGIGVTRIGCTWDADTNDVTKTTSWVQRPGAKRVAGVSSLGWSGALDTYRPMMSYDELGGMLEAGPSTLYDALSKALGLEQIADGIARLEKRHKALKSPGDALATRRRTLQAEASVVDDERAQQASDLLKKAQPDSGALRALATGVILVDNGPLAQLRALELLTGPPADEVTNAAHNLSRAVGDMAKAGEAELARNAARLDVRRHALRVQEQFGDMICPVCAGAHLDQTWAETTREDIARRSRELEALEAARAALERARTGARRVVSPRPASLDRDPLPTLAQAVTQARQAWDLWAAAPEGDLDLSAHLELYWGELDTALQSLRAAVAQELQHRQDAWTPIATKVAAFSADWDAWSSTTATVGDVAAATKWLKTNDTRLKNERLLPISDAARKAWAMLRQESNVDLGSLTLEGAATRRRVSIEATVDGRDAGALAVMSQGELHALALALFLPRASMPESPFRFVVLDDPVQAMDPAKVEGLVQLLAELAATRQVIVLSHDDRLPAAARRARVGARILEVTRGAGSTVSVSDSLDPAKRYLDDAFALVLDVGLPEETLRRTLPGMLRFAVESAARDVVFDRRLTRGDALADVEELWSTHPATRERVSLAIYGEVRNLDDWLVRGYRKFALGVITGGMHSGLKNTADGKDACRAVENVITDLRAGAKQ